MSSVENFKEKLYQEKKVYGSKGMYSIEYYVENTRELRMIETYLPDGSLVERLVFRNGRLHANTVPYPGGELLYKTTYRKDGSIEFSSFFINDEVYTKSYDEAGNVKSTEVRDGQREVKSDATEEFTMKLRDYKK